MVFLNMKLGIVLDKNIAKKKKGRECPNYKIMMEYLEDLDAYQCPKCKKKFRDKYK